MSCGLPHEAKEFMCTCVQHLIAMRPQAHSDLMNSEVRDIEAFGFQINGYSDVEAKSFK